MYRWKALAPLFSLLFILSVYPANSQQILLDGIQEPGVPIVVAPTLALPALAERKMHESSTESPHSSPKLTTILMPLRTRDPQLRNSSYYRMQGQDNRASFALFLPHKINTATLRLTTKSALNVLPERSEIELLVNGSSVGAIRPQNFDTDRTDTVEVPAGLLVAGPNVITLIARQVHRVLCGPEAAFSLWTDLALAQSGIEVPISDLSLDTLGFLAATAAQLASETPYSIHISGADFSISDAAPVIARVQEVFGGTPPEILFQDYYSVSPSPPQLARVTALPPDLSMPNGPEFRRGGDGAIVLMVNSGRYAEVASLLLAALDKSILTATTSLVEPGQKTTLSALGAPIIEGRGNYTRAPISFRLPQEWLLLASQKAELRLNYQFDTRLPKGALLLVKINNSTVRLLPLDQQADAGRTLETLSIPFAASLLRPGLNRIDFESLVPGDPPDQACTHRDNPTFIISGTSELFVPASPAMSRPSLNAALDALQPENIHMSDEALKLIPIGMLPQLGAIYASEPSKVRDGAGTPEVGLTVGIASDLTEIEGAVIADYKFELETILLESPDARSVQPDPWLAVNSDGWPKSLGDANSVTDIPSQLLNGIRSLWRGPGPALGDWLRGQSAQALLIQPSFEDPGKIWLILRSQHDLAPVIASLAAAHHEFEGPRGQVSVLLPERGWISWRSADMPLRLLEPLTIKNIRAVIGNYVTIAPGRYIIPLLILTICSAIVAIGIAFMTRRRKT